MKDFKNVKYVVLFFAILLVSLNLANALTVSNVYFNDSVGNTVFVNGSVDLAEVNVTSAGIFFNNLDTNGTFSLNSASSFGFVNLDSPNNDVRQFRAGSVLNLYLDRVDLNVSGLPGDYFIVGSYTPTTSGACESAVNLTIFNILATMFMIGMAIFIVFLLIKNPDPKMVVYGVVAFLIMLVGLAITNSLISGLCVLA